MLASSCGTVQRSPVGRSAISSWALATAIPTKICEADIHDAWVARPCRMRAQGHRTTVRALGVHDVTTLATLRSRWTQAESVYHVRVSGNGDSPTSRTKDTRLEADSRRSRCHTPPARLAARRPPRLRRRQAGPWTDGPAGLSCAQTYNVTIEPAITHTRPTMQNTRQPAREHANMHVPKK